jgi:hypothetical protein
LAVAAVFGAGAVALHAASGQPASPAGMPPPAMMARPETMVLPAPVFGFAGKECPKGSELYKGPEALSAQGEGVVYCSFVRRYREFPKAMFKGKCPNGADPYTDEGFKPDAKSIWCDMSFQIKPLSLKPLRPQKK